MDVVIVGGGPAGLAVARGYRDGGGRGSVLILSDDAHPPYNRPPLTKDYLRGESEAADLPLVPDAWYADQQVALRVSTRVSALDLAARTVEVSDDAGRVEQVSYRRLALATGSSPKPLPIDGADLPGVIYVRDRTSAERLRALRGPDRRVVVIGSGFIGCEAAASLARTGATVVLATDEDEPHQARLGAEAGARMHAWLTADGVEVRTGNGVTAIARTGQQWTVTLADGQTLSCDGVVSGSGVSPNVALAERAGLDIVSGGVATDARMQTSDPHVWTVGDIAYAGNDAAQRPLRVEHWGEAETMGEIAGAVMAGGDRRWAQAPGFWSEIGDRTLKYSAWGDGWETAELTEAPDGNGWAVWYGTADVLVGVLSSDWDEAYERGQEWVEAHAPISVIDPLARRR